jgi:hypothetical protein
MSELILWTIEAMALFLVLLVPTNYLLGRLLVRDPAEFWPWKKTNVGVVNVPVFTLTGNSSFTLRETVLDFKGAATGSLTTGGYASSVMRQIAGG